MSAETLMAKLQKLPRLATDQIMVALDTSGEMLKEKAILEINTGGRSGRMYGTHQASAAGEYPKTQTGALVASIQKSLLPLAVTVGTSLDHGRYLEFGTSRMAARPWLRPSYNWVLRFAQQSIGSAVQSAISSVV